MNTKSLIGMAEGVAVQIINAAGFKAFIAARDGVGFVCTANMDPMRVKLTIEDGIVTEACAR